MANGWAHAHPMQLKSQAHEALSLLHQQEGEPNAVAMDGTKEQASGTFRHKR